MICNNICNLCTRMHFSDKSTHSILQFSHGSVMAQVQTIGLSGP